MFCTTALLLTQTLRNSFPTGSSMALFIFASQMIIFYLYCLAREESGHNGGDHVFPTYFHNVSSQGPSTNGFPETFNFFSPFLLYWSRGYVLPV